MEHITQHITIYFKINKYNTLSTCYGKFRGRRRDSDEREKYGTYKKRQLSNTLSTCYTFTISTVNYFIIISKVFKNVKLCVIWEAFFFLSRNDMESLGTLEPVMNKT